MRFPLQALLHRLAKPGGEFLKCIYMCGFGVRYSRQTAPCGVSAGVMTGVFKITRIFKIGV